MVKSNEKMVIIPKDIKAKKIKIHLDIDFLNSIIAFITKKSVLQTRKVLNTIHKLFNMLDEEAYKENPYVSTRIWLIKKMMYCITKLDFENTPQLVQYCRDDIECTPLVEDILDTISDFKINYQESKNLIKLIEDRVMFGYTITMKDYAEQIFDKVDSNDFRSYRSLSDSLYDLCTTVINLQRATKSNISDQTFSLRDEYFESTVTDSVNDLKDRNKIFLTGIRRLNTILSPGYMSKRLYTYLAFPGGGKSEILLKSALDIKKYNKNITTKDPEKIPTVLFITMENNIAETVERIFNITTSEDDIRNFTPKEVIRKLRKDGEMVINEHDKIDIVIKYFPNRSISTNDLYSIIQDIEDDNGEVIALFLDYIKRIRPAEKAQTEKEELKAISNELKTLATTLDIPVITAQQLNRTAASVVDAAMQSNKQDLAKLVGRDGVAGAWEIMENSDVVIVLNRETKKDTGEKFMTFKLLKRRYRSSETSEKLRRLDYFNHPYEPGNDIRLIDDLNLAKSVSVFSLAGELVPTETQKRGRKNAIKRKEVYDGDLNAVPEYESFDFNNSMNF